MGTSAQVAVIGFLRFPPDRIADILPHVRTLVETTQRDDGCIAYDVAVDALQPGVLRFSELWPDRDSLERHIEAPHVPAWRAAAQSCGLLEKHYDILDIRAARVL